MRNGIEMTKIHQKIKYPNSWRKLTLNDCGNWIGGGTPLKSNPDYWIDGNVPWATSQDIIEPMLTSTTYKITELAVKETATNVIPKNSIILVMRSGILRRKFPVTKTIGDVAINQDLRALIPNNDIDLEYLYNFIMHKEKKILETCVKVGTTVESVELNFLKKFDVQLPPLKEQQKIASILSTWDKAIELKEKLIEQKKEQKKGLMQKLLTGEVRLPGFEGEWEEASLGKIANIIMGQSPNSSSYNENYEGLPLIQGNADCENRKTKPRIWTTKPTKQCKVGDIIMTVRAPVGHISRSLHNACIGRGVCAIRSKVVQDFLFYQLIFKENYWIRISQGSTFDSVNSNDIKELKLLVPKAEEQKEIASLLKAFDKELDLLIQQVNQIKQQKKGLMQNLLTGKVRVRV